MSQNMDGGSVNSVGADMHAHLLFTTARCVLAVDNEVSCALKE